MKDLLEPLTESEIQTLDEFLLDRFQDEDEMIGRDEGLLNISELDGFLTAHPDDPAADQAAFALANALLDLKLYQSAIEP